MNARRKGLRRSLVRPSFRGRCRSNHRCIPPEDCWAWKGRWETWKSCPTSIRSGLFTRARMGPASPNEHASIRSCRGKGISVERRRTDLITKSSGLSGLTKSVSASSRWKVKLWRGKVHRAFHLPELVRDIYCLGPRRDPLASRGKIHLSQIGPGTGASYFSFERPDAGSALYFQNLTALNDWFELTHAEPDGIVAGDILHLRQPPVEHAP